MRVLGPEKLACPQGHRGPSWPGPGPDWTPGLPASRCRRRTCRCPFSDGDEQALVHSGRLTSVFGTRMHFIHGVLLSRFSYVMMRFGVLFLCYSLWETHLYFLLFYFFTLVKPVPDLYTADGVCASDPPCT
ncbi:hypothetical protein HJG60_009403 [Phyllostomus discolor]|uniref:Uncharacterized protein n=1 Tax=Phyllostomus discolor TaxID=89673 RepID=A0A834DCQ8_9CHIR|nr:hypothetical protein HJG60_009403 [Phyllostomus discolor]